MTRTERTYYLVFALYSLASWFVAPVYPLFLAGCGLDPLQVNLVLANFLIVTFLFEVPTGAVADRLGRKPSFLASCAIRTLAFWLYSRATSFSDCLVAETVDGIGITLASGSLDAWAVDGIRAEGDEGRIEPLFARAQIAARASMIGGGIVCGYLAAYDMTLPWLVGAAIFAATGFLGLALMNEPPLAAESTASRPTFGQLVVEGFGTVGRSPVLLLVCALSGAIVFAAIPAHMLWQPRLIALSGEGVWLMGWIWALLNIVAVAGSLALPPLLRRFRREWVLCAAILWRGATLGIAAAATTFSPAVAGWLLQELGSGVSEPVLQSWMNENVAARARATVLSVRSMAVTFTGGVGLVVIGLAARDAGIPLAWGISAALFVLMAPAFLLLGRLAAAPQAAPKAEAELVPQKVVPPVVP
jgi:MFS family permease